MKNLPLHELHVSNGAKFGPFGGFEMPLFYRSGTIKEHLATRESAGLFDISHMVVVLLEGAGAAALIEKLCPYLAGEQEIGRARYSFFLNDQAGIIDDLIITRLGEERYSIVCNAGCAEKDLDHIRHHAPKFDARMQIHGGVLVALQGPNAESVLTDKGVDCAGLAFMQAVEPRDGWILSRSGYTGEDGFEIALPADEADDLVRAIADDDRVTLAGLAARDTLRLEAGLPLYGQDLNSEITPMEAGLSWAIPKSHREGGDFIGAIALGQKFQAGRARKRVGLRPEGQTPVRAHAEITAGDGSLAGEITSGGFGPSVGHPIAFGLVDVDCAQPLRAERRGTTIGLEVVGLPFVEHRYKR